MRITAELRWFEMGTIPEAIAAWFAQPRLGQFQQPPTHREDNYLYLPSQEHVGIKTREGQLEIKLRQAQLGKLPLGMCGWGWAEQWVKWRGEDQSEAKLPDPVSEGIWLKVEKTRSQRQYQLLPNQNCVAVPVDAMAAAGCTVELTQLQIQGQAWWSLGLESFGETLHLTHQLQSVAKCLGETGYPKTWELERSYAYPHWFAIALQSKPT